MVSHNFDKQLSTMRPDGDCHRHTTICSSLVENYCTLNPREIKPAFISIDTRPSVSHHGNQRQRAGGTEAKETEINDILPFPLYNK